jgi:uncharacterized protein with von Willebrand factor type A (vWA) domain
MGTSSARTGEAANTPEPVRETVRRLLSTASFAPYTSGNHSVSERTAHDAVTWCDEQWTRIAREAGADEIASEEQSLLLLQGCQSLSEAGRHLPPPHRRTLRAIADTILADGESKDPVETRARIGFVCERWREILDRDRTTRQTRDLGRALGSFVRELSAALPRLVRAQQVVRDVFGSDASLWDGSPGEWRGTDWDSLADYASRLESWPELTRLAEIIGRSHVATERRLVSRTVRDVVVRPIGLGKSEVTGFNFGDDVTSLIPSEISLLADPDTEELFYAKLAHKELLQFDYRREKVVRETRDRTVHATEDVIVRRGPVVVCVDTSGSMIGDPEMVSKTVTLALARRLHTDRRDIHVIAFSTDTRSFVLGAESPDFRALCGFLSGGFHGGTDLRPALHEALAALETNRFRNADVLVLSDFRVPKIADRFIERIKRQQSSGTLFNSLTVARGGVRDPLHIFDNSWLFDISEGVRGIRPESLRPIP